MERPLRQLKRKERRERERQMTRPRLTVDAAIRALTHIGFEVENGSKHLKLVHPVTGDMIGLPYRSTQSILSNGVSNQVHDLLSSHRQHSERALQTKRDRD